MIYNYTKFISINENDIQPHNNIQDYINFNNYTQLRDTITYYNNEYNEPVGDVKTSLEYYISNGYIVVRKYINSGGDTKINNSDIIKIANYSELKSKLNDEYKDLLIGHRIRKKKENVEYLSLHNFYMSNHTKITIYNLSKYIKNNKIKNSMILYRGIKGDGIKYFKSLNVNDTYIDKSFSSVSSIKLERFNDDFNIQILVKKGKPVANIGNVSEFEYLIDKGAKFKVIETNNRNKMVVELL